MRFTKMETIKKYTLVMIRDGNNFLLGLKKRGFGVGKWNGFGGKVNPNESIEDAAQRELHEECGLACKDLSKLAIIRFEFENEPVQMEVHVFIGSEIHGTLTESEEMYPQWFNINDVPFKQMWIDDVHWWPYLIEKKKFLAYFLYRGYETILSYKIDEVRTFEQNT